MWRRIKKWCFRTTLFIILIPIVCIIALRWVNPITSSIMLQNNVLALTSDREFSQYQWRDWDEISEHVPVAIIAAEDQRFPEHFGIDLSELHKAISSSSDHPRGASTITQQVAKNMFLWPGRSYVRKGLEAGLALMIEVFWSKQRILEIYINIAQTGENLFGVNLASTHYYNKMPGELNRHEAARIAAVLPNPSKYSVSNPSQFVVERQQWIMKQMKQLGGNDLLKQL